MAATSRVNICFLLLWGHLLLCVLLLLGCELLLLLLLLS
jgi:hypothetical protein